MNCSQPSLGEATNCNRIHKHSGNYPNCMRLRQIMDVRIRLRRIAAVKNTGTMDGKFIYFNNLSVRCSPHYKRLFLAGAEIQGSSAKEELHARFHSCREGAWEQAETQVKRGEWLLYSPSNHLSCSPTRARHARSLWSAPSCFCILKSVPALIPCCKNHSRTGS